jgi:DNA repair protein RadD
MSQYTLRDYQDESVERSLDFLSSTSNENGLIIHPTGAGKSLIIANIVKRLNSTCLVFQPSRELLEQNYGKFCDYGFKPSIYSASMGSREVGDITLATIGSVVKKAHLFKTVQYIICDECHLVNSKGGMYHSLVNDIGHARVIGLTATPYRLVTDGYGGSILKFLTRTRPRIFSKVVHAVQNSTLFERGFLCPLEYRKVGEFDRTRLKDNSTGADYTDESVSNYQEAMDFKSLVVQTVQDLLSEGRRHVLVFTRFVKEADFVATQIPNSAIVTSETGKKERREIVESFKSGSIPVVCNVGVLGIGFDFPELDCIVLARPTKSLGLYYQQVGRGVRTAAGKDNCLIVDMVEMVEQFGRVEDLTLDCGPHETWFVRTGNRQLTNVYFGSNANQEMNLPPWFPRLDFGEPVATARGLLRTAEPTPRFWQLWRDEQKKSEILAAGILPTKLESGKWVVSIK